MYKTNNNYSIRLTRLLLIAKLFHIEHDKYIYSKKNKKKRNRKENKGEEHHSSLLRVNFHLNFQYSIFQILPISYNLANLFPVEYN